MVFAIIIYRGCRESVSIYVKLVFFSVKFSIAWTRFPVRTHTSVDVIIILSDIAARLQALWSEHYHPSLQHYSGVANRNPVIVLVSVERRKNWYWVSEKRETTLSALPNALANYKAIATYSNDSEWAWDTLIGLLKTI